jgi:hypothetical protein
MSVKYYFSAKRIMPQCVSDEGIAPLTLQCGKQDRWNAGARPVGCFSSCSLDAYESRYGRFVRALKHSQLTGGDITNTCERYTSHNARKTVQSFANDLRLAFLSCPRAADREAHSSWSGQGYDAFSFGSPGERIRDGNVNVSIFSYGELSILHPW